MSYIFKDFNEKTFISNMISDLNTLNQILSQEHKICCFANQIASIVGQIKQSKSFEYELKPLEFKFIEYPSHLSHTNIENLRLFFDIKVKGEYKNIPELKDPLRYLEFNICITGNDPNNKNYDPFYSIHFDRHQEGKNPSKEIHPAYHFQFGGRKIKDIGIDFGQALFMDTPRIMYHPMDVFLGIDFILSNFFPEAWRRFKKNGTYANLIKKYQKYFIYPYFKTISKHFEETNSQPWPSIDIFPQLSR
ncbi:hypothetical protein [Campylobacter sp. CCUG 57310]|uniref:hypothetical protein n=1 Tax=Campylobacter sp. CCUG 57310 TaxID=2517362 RepID=UPI0015641ECB|nr:hypothetical protein [Campylobacter sp. CCUG 57310]QKF91615.1 hypothetical protein CORI_0387 [Campylobacter sp. CCUG 57310]